MMFHMFHNMVCDTLRLNIIYEMNLETKRNTLINSRLVKFATILHSIYSNAFFSMKIFNFVSNLTEVFQWSI